MKKILKALVIPVLIGFLAFVMGYKWAKNEIIHKVLENKKDCYDLLDLYIIINK